MGNTTRTIFQNVVVCLFVCIIWWRAEFIHGGDVNLTKFQLNYYKSNPEWWEVAKTNEPIYAVMGDAVVMLRKVDLDLRKVHTCYEYKVFRESIEVRTRTFCYPSVILTGHKKCSTSALYALLQQYPTTVKEGPGGKENCAFTGTTASRSLAGYFDSFPATVSANEMIVDGCIYPEDNLKTRAILRNPHTFYLVSVTTVYFT